MRLTVRVIGARNLRAMHFNGFSYPYVKLQVGKQRFKTKVAKMNLNPEWDQEFSFVVTHVREVLKLQVYDEDMLSIDDFLGQVKVPLEDLLPAENFSFATCWYQLLPNSKSDKAVDCGEICVAISLETAEATRSLTKTEASEEVQQAPTVFEAPLSQNNDICSEVTFDELLRSFESRHGGVGMPVNLQGILINQSYFTPPSDLNKFLFSPDSDFRQTLVQLQGCTDFKTEPWRIDKDGESLKRVISYTTAPSKLVRAVKATEEQSYLKANEKEYSVLLSASTPDLPCGTYFRTEVFFRIMPGPELDSEQQTSHLVISWRMNFLQSTLMKGMIENEARRSLEQNYSQFSDLLSEKIKPIDVDDAGSDKEQVLASLQGGKESDWNYIGEIDTTTMPAKQSNYKENTKVFTFEEVAKHNSKHDCWLLIGGKVYDVTKFLEDHPGGDDVLLSSTAKDATNDFEDVGHSSTARAMMDEYYIGEIDATTIPAMKKFILPTQSNYKAYAIGEYYDGEYNDAESSLSSESISTLLSSLEMTDQVTELKALESVLLDENAEPAKLSYPFIRYITRNFSQEIGRGGFGVVYLGDLGTGKVAVKRLSIAQGFSDALFVDEIKCLIRTKHRNIVRFLGYCADTHGELVPFNRSYVLAEVPQRLLCFEYVPKGNLQKYLKDTSHKDEWPIRYQMIRGICYGLNYLHEQRIIHLDLKPDNILLDAHMNPKITDFGISRCFDEGVSRIYTVNVRGTKGSIAPETIDSGEITFKSDIYGLGNIIMHLLTGRNQFDFENWQTSLDMDGPQVRSCTEIAKSCVAFDQRKRPTIGEIVKKLNEIERL